MVIVFLMRRATPRTTRTGPLVPYTTLFPSEGGLVRSRPQRGTLVVKISQHSVEDARVIREAVECAVAREAAKIRDPVALGRLTDSLTRQRRAARAKDVQGFFSLDEEFHQSLAEAAGRPAAWRAVEDEKPQMERVRYLSLEDATRSEEHTSELQSHKRN